MVYVVNCHFVLIRSDNNESKEYLFLDLTAPDLPETLVSPCGMWREDLSLSSCHEMRQHCPVALPRDLTHAFGC